MMNSSCSCSYVFDSYLWESADGQLRHAQVHASL